MNPRIWILKEVTFALRQLVDEIPILRSKKVIYFPDFNLLHPYVYSQDISRYKITDTFGKCLFTLIMKLSLPDRICLSISLPTIMEFLFSVNGYYDIFGRNSSNKELSSYVYKCIKELEEGKIAIRDIKSDKVKRFILSENMMDGVDKKVEDFIKMFRSNKIDLLTDHYSAKDINRLLQKNGTMLQSINEAMEFDRIDKDKRSTLSRYLSYKVDAHNIFLPILNTIEDDKSTNFVCSGKFNKWATSPILQTHQRSPLFLIMLIGTIGQLPSNMTFNEKVSQLSTFAENALEAGTALLEDSIDSIFSLDLDRRVDAFISSHLDYYIAMTKSKSSLENKTSSSPFGAAVSYDDYLEIGKVRSNNAKNHINTIHELIDDSTDDMYRDFVDDVRFKKAFPSLKIG